MSQMTARRACRENSCTAMDPKIHQRTPEGSCPAYVDGFHDGRSQNPRAQTAFSSSSGVASAGDRRYRFGGLAEVLQHSGVPVGEPASCWPYITWAQRSGAGDIPRDRAGRCNSAKQFLRGELFCDYIKWL